jgi:beta-N-acetylhexosaminidase
VHNALRKNTIRNKLAILGIALFACLLALSACSAQPVEADTQEGMEGSGAGPHIPVVIEGDNISRVMSSMTLREKIGQLFIIRPEVLGGSTRKLTEEGRTLYEKYPAGGFCLFAQNVADPEQLMDFSAQLHSLGSRIHPILTIDEEGGSVTRIASNWKFDVPRYRDMGKTEASAEESAQQIASYLKVYGIDLDFAPVADVNTNPKNPVIGTRAYSSDPVEAAGLVAEAVKGFHAGHTGCCLKHWPGHGDTKTDTHKGSSSTAKTWEEMLSCEVLPFVSGIGAGADMVMVSHIAAPEVTGSNEPASLSSVLMTEKLRGELGFEGVIITDSFEMKAISELYHPGEAAVKAIEAGADIVLMPSDYEAAFEAVLAAVESGEISEERLDESLRRILRLKADLAGL